MNYLYFLAAAILTFNSIFSQAQAPAQKTFNILIVPGHDVSSGGANYKNIYERDLVAKIGTKIADILNKEPGYKITLSRDEKEWNPALSDYFANNKQEIIDWKNKCQEGDKALLASGQKKYVADSANHSEVSADTAVELYGTNKWANENNIDLILNLHFNDEQRPDMNQPGDLKGFDIFVPESQMKNSSVSKIIGADIFKKLETVEPPESGNLLQDQSLIALGASGTLNAPSVLIEYAYVYEKVSLDKMAEQTALGIEDYAKTFNVTK